MLKEEYIQILLKNVVESQDNIELAYLYSNQGLLISKYNKIEQEISDVRDIDEIYGALTTIVEKLIDKVNLEYKIGHFGSGSFETSEHRIIYLEVGFEAILLLVCNYKADLNKLFPIGYLICEKIAQLLEERFDFKYNSLDIPDLNIHESISLELEPYSIDEKNQIYTDLTTKHQIKRGKNIQKQFKLIILGSAGVGKTTLVNCFLKRGQSVDYRPTLGISISTLQYYIQGFKDDIIKFLIYDFAGQEFFKRFRHYYYKGANCAFIVYDITKRDTFDNAIDFWIKDVRKELGPIPFVLIGNKIDLEDKRKVFKEEGLKKAEELGCSFIETSALYNINVQDTFKIVGIGLFFKLVKES